VLNRTDAFICGIETHICIYQTVRDLLQQSYCVEVVSDAVSSRTQTNKQLALQRMHHLGAGLTSVEMCLFDLIRTAKHPKFRDISRLVK
jgi:nicotinamidase-related amidase